MRSRDVLANVQAEMERILLPEEVSAKRSPLSVSYVCTRIPSNPRRRLSSSPVARGYPKQMDRQAQGKEDVAKNRRRKRGSPGFRQTQRCHIRKPPIRCIHWNTQRISYSEQFLSSAHPNT